MTAICRTWRRGCSPLGVATGLLQIPVIDSIACGDQRLNCSMRSSMEPYVEQFSNCVPRAMEPITGIRKRLLATCRSSGSKRLRSRCTEAAAVAHALPAAAVCALAARSSPTTSCTSTGRSSHPIRVLDTRPGPAQQRTQNTAPSPPIITVIMRRWTIL